MFYYVGSSTFLASDDLQKFLLVEILSSGVSCLSGCLLILLAVFKTPEFLKVHRVSLLNLTIGSTLFSFLLIFLAPSVGKYEDVFCIEILGMIRAPYVMASVTTAMFIMNAFNLTLSFFFRYIQIAHDHLSDLLKSKQFISLLFLLDLVFLAVSFVIVHVLKAELPQSLPPDFDRPLQELRSRDNSVICIAFSSSPQKAAGIAFCVWFFLCTFGMIFFAIMTLLKLCSQKMFVSKRTFELQKMMATVVFINSAIPFFLGWIPLCVLIAAFQFFPNLLTLILNLEMLLQNTMFFSLNLISISYLRPYREAIVRFTKRCCRSVLRRDSEVTPSQDRTNSY
ncbi:hypothetical protein QR680_004900 [Steinernema hermaphroditum]|uniref:Uncharacterized protein n=1 Tax=Steinernema hermaphroditum TaxID=289476 RepID=A0AA39HSD9_9BILA|nr:hypothetical protein QR680_004900 [Steinernema hermaphroditum]